MKRVILLLAAVVLVCTGAAQAYAVMCLSGSEPPTYQYQVTLSGGEIMDRFEVGTCDPNIGNYSNWVNGPVGWSPGISPGMWGAQPDEPPPATPHGLVSPGPSGTCMTTVNWTGFAVGPTTLSFGFDNPYAPHDVGFGVGMFGAMVYAENWAAPVGMGSGPIHAPIVPEPGTYALFALGAVGLALYRRCKK